MYFYLSNLYSTMDSSWTIFFIVVVLLVLALASPWIFPNKSVSKNRHDTKF